MPSRQTAPVRPPLTAKHEIKRWRYIHLRDQLPYP